MYFDYEERTIFQAGSLEITDSRFTLSPKINKSLQVDLAQTYEPMTPLNLGTKVLSLALNFLPALPPSLTELTKLTVLNRSYNNIKSLQPLSQCHFLEFINASHNVISSLAAVANLTNLQELYVGHNKIAEADL